MNKTAQLLLKIANELDELGFADKAEEIDKIVEAMPEVQPAAQPQIQGEPIKQGIKEIEGDKTFKRDVKKAPKKKGKGLGIVHGEDFIMHSKSK